MPTELQPPLNVNEVAQLLRVNHKIVRELIHNGTLPAVRIGCQWRIRPEAVAELLGATE